MKASTISLQKKKKNESRDGSTVVQNAEDHGTSMKRPLEKH
jgi:hypothetical protein